jgi:predicted nuclease of predicted toxin-antitoxin system
VNFLVDAQLPPLLCGPLRKRGHQAWHVFEIGLAQASDPVIWNHALDRKAVIVTKDEDFAGRTACGKGGPAVVWLRVGNCSNEALLRWFEPMLDGIIKSLESGEMLIEIR